MEGLCSPNESASFWSGDISHLWNLQRKSIFIMAWLGIQNFISECHSGEQNGKMVNSSILLADAFSSLGICNE